MKIIIYGRHEDYKTFLGHMETIPALQYRKFECTSVTSYDDFLKLLHAKRHDLIIVLEDGAEGMEGIIAARTLCPETMRVWISNDGGFGVQARRMDCAYFAVKPITVDTVIKAYRAFQRF